MKRTIREKRSIIIGFIFYWILLIGLVLFLSLYIVNSLYQIEDKKKETRSIYNEIVDKKLHWLNYSEFKSMNKSMMKWDKYTLVLNNITKDFYDSYLVNKKDKSFDEFIKKKTKEMNNSHSIQVIAENEKQIVNILPVYSEKNIDIWEEHLTDFKFINYIESIIDTFNLNTNASIWIWNIEILKDYMISGWSKESNDTNIYSIPLSLNLSWTKKNIIDFLYFIENVWNIKIDKNTIIINKNNGFLSTNWFSKVLSWDRYTTNYNIFEHQIIDIKDITFPKYLDDSYKIRKNRSFIDFIKKTQWNEKYEINVSLRFYVKWLPKARIISTINNIILNYKLIYWYINTNIWKWLVKWTKLLRMKKEQNLLKNLNKKTKLINKNAKNSIDLEKTYNDALNIDQLIKPLCDKYRWICKY